MIITEKRSYKLPNPYITGMSIEEQFDKAYINESFDFRDNHSKFHFYDGKTLLYNCRIVGTDNKEALCKVVNGAQLSMYRCYVLDGACLVQVGNYAKDGKDTRTGAILHECILRNSFDVAFVVQNGAYAGLTKCLIENWANCGALALHNSALSVRDCIFRNVTECPSLHSIWKNMIHYYVNNNKDTLWDIPMWNILAGLAEVGKNIHKCFIPGASKAVIGDFDSQVKSSHCYVGKHCYAQNRLWKMEEPEARELVNHLEETVARFHYVDPSSIFGNQ